jgi:hypothetical protein
MASTVIAYPKISKIEQYLDWVNFYAVATIN